MGSEEPEAMEEAAESTWATILLVAEEEAGSATAPTALKSERLREWGACPLPTARSAESLPILLLPTTAGTAEMAVSAAGAACRTTVEPVAEEAEPRRRARAGARARGRGRGPAAGGAGAATQGEAA